MEDAEDAIMARKASLTNLTGEGGGSAQGEGGGGGGGGSNEGEGNDSDGEEKENNITAAQQRGNMPRFFISHLRIWALFR